MKGTRWLQVIGWALVLGVLAPSEPVHAMFTAEQLEDIPIERLVANAQRHVEAHPKAVESRYALARLYSMAYAVGHTSIRAHEAGLSRYEQNPWEYAQGPRAPDQAQARQDLQLAIQAYREALRLDPTHLYALLGFAWCEAEAGELDEALAAYRRAHEEAWQA